MESQPQNSECRINPVNFHPCSTDFKDYELMKLLMYALKFNYTNVIFRKLKTNSIRNLVKNCVFIWCTVAYAAPNKGTAI